MADMSQETNYMPDTIAGDIGGLLQEHKGQDVSVLDLRGINNWTDFFIVTTVSSRTHMDGLERHIRDFCREKDIDVFRSSRTKGSYKNQDDEWRLIDLGSVIIHLMTSDARDFYELERLWRPLQHPKGVDG
ncbi:MAG: ribosome silencing factor [Treponema sp.]|nr:ribosome silencing factor [Treponema sp.]